MPLISVLIPVYNVENFIRRCLESILSQSFQDFEIIVVDDASPDSSLEIVEKYANSDSRIKIISHPQNMGLMWARKTGIENASGDYIFFCDSDDYIPHDALQNLYQAALHNSPDLVIGNYITIDSNGVESYCPRSRQCGHSPEEMKVKILQNCKSTLWGNLYKSSILKNFSYTFFKNQTLSEDRLLLTQVLENCKSLVPLNKATYYYCLNSASSTQTIYNDTKIKTQLKAWSWLLDFYKEDANLNQKANYFVLLYLLHGIESGWNKNLLKDYPKILNLISYRNISKNFKFPVNLHFILCTKSPGYSRSMHSIRKMIQKVKH